VIGLPFFQVDAFTDRAFAGNPAAVMPLDAWQDDGTLQAIAAENNLAETAFTVRTADGYDLRWFTPTVEVAMCGHATLASAHILLGDASEIVFATRKAGKLSVRRDGDGYAMSLPAWEAAPEPLPAIVAAIGGDPQATLWREGGYAVIVYPDEAAIRALTPDFAALRPLGDTLYIATAPGDATDVVSRCFAPGAGIDEDPVTGSAHAVIAPYWAERLGRDRFTAFQASERGGHVDCELVGDRVVLRGRCVTVIEGRFSL
jgi:PhzF family phenazine biosynthesis protein